MGVRGLQTFMEFNCPNVAYQVNIKEIVEIYRKETDREVVIVVDGSSCLRPLYDDLDWICGGQNREFAERFRNFIEAFQKLGVTLVFFFDGPTQPRKRKVWVERRIKSLSDVYGAFDHILKGKHPSSYSGNSGIILPTGTSYVASHAIKTSHGCEIHRSVKECDEEIAEYAVRHNCFAILAQDSDYVIYDVPQYYLSISHLNVEKMTTIMYNRWALARQLRLSPSLLPLFASLVGNDIIRADDLLEFHKRICKFHNPQGRHNPRARPNTKDVMYSVADFIRNSTDESHIHESLPTISKSVFGNEENALQLNISVESYCVSADQEHKPTKLEPSRNTERLLKKSWRQIKKYAEKRFQNGDLDSMIYAIMQEFPYESSTGIEDFRVEELPPSAGVYRPLRQRIYGIILHEKRGDPETRVVDEWCMEGEGSLNEASSVPVIPPKSDVHPGLMALWDETDMSEELLTKKWQLLSNAVSDNLDSNKLKSVPPTLLAPTLLLYIMNNEVPTRFMKAWEVDAFIATAVMLPTYTISDLAEIHIEKAIPRAVQLACIFGRGASIIQMLNDACGRPVSPLKISAWCYFDGKLFQKLYHKAQCGSKIVHLCDHQVSPLEQFNLVRSIVFPSGE